MAPTPPLALGSSTPGPPLRRRHTCEWPGISERHRLGVYDYSDDSRRVIAGAYTMATGVFEVWRLD